MFSNMVIFLFATIGIFALLFAAIPAAYFTYSSVDSTLGTDKEIAEYYDLQNVTIYSNTGGGNMSYPWSSLNDHPSAPEHKAGLPGNQYLEVWWWTTPHWGYLPGLEFRHVEQWWPFGWRIIARLNIEGEDKTPMGTHLDGTEILNNYNSDRNASLFYASGSAIVMNCFFSYNQTLWPDIGTAWNNGDIDYVLSYDVDWNATSISALTILGQLLTFQAPSLGLTGTGGTLISSTIAIPFWICTAVVIIKLVQSVVPLIKGIEE